MRYEKSCGFVLIKDNQALLLKHRSGNHWDFCKGHVEANESELETALREVKEELNGQVEPIAGFRETIEYSPKPNTEKLVVFFLGYFSGEIKVQSEEIIEAQWFDFDEVYDQLTFIENKKVWLKALNHIHAI